MHFSFPTKKFICENTKRMFKKKNQLTETAAALPKDGNVGLLVKIIIFLQEYFSLAVAIASRKGQRCAFKRPVIPSTSQ